MYAQLRRDILDKRRSAGSECSTRSLASSFACGTQVVRNALLLLEEEGYLARGVNETFIVRAWSTEEVGVAFDLRSMLLNLASDRCRTRLTDYERNNLRRIMTAPHGPSHSQPALTAADYIAVTSRLHSQICEGSRVHGISEAFSTFFPQVLHRAAAELISPRGRQDRLDGYRSLVSYIVGDTESDGVQVRAEYDRESTTMVAAWYSSTQRMTPYSDQIEMGRLKSGDIPEPQGRSLVSAAA